MHRIVIQITISLLVMGATSISKADKGLENLTMTPQTPTLFRAVYKARFKGLPVNAKGIRELSQNEDGSYKFSSTAKSFLASVSEFSVFKIEGRDFIPIEYQYHRSGIGKNRNAILSFDQEKMRVLNNVQSIPWNMAITEESLDKLLYQLKMREDLVNARNLGLPWPKLNYEVADGGRLKKYEFGIIGEEVLSTPIGKINTIKVTRVRQSGTRKTIFWLAPEYDFLLVRLHQLKGEDTSFELHLTEYRVDGKKIKPS